MSLSGSGLGLRFSINTRSISSLGLGLKGYDPKHEKYLVLVLNFIFLFIALHYIKISFKIEYI